MVWPDYHEGRNWVLSGQNIHSPSDIIARKNLLGIQEGAKHPWMDSLGSSRDDSSEYFHEKHPRLMMRVMMKIQDCDWLSEQCGCDARNPLSKLMLNPQELTLESQFTVRNYSMKSRHSDSLKKGEESLWRSSQNGITANCQSWKLRNSRTETVESLGSDLRGSKLRRCKISSSLSPSFAFAITLTTSRFFLNVWNEAN